VRRSQIFDDNYRWLMATHPTVSTLREYIQRRKQLKVVELFGTIDYDEDCNYKQQRQTLWMFLLIVPFCPWHCGATQQMMGSIETSMAF